jgi:4a-hydroxytetrahydrobiopterin dehydratase
MAFANQIMPIAEANDHHPALLIQYGSVTVNWWSHSIGGLHLNDFVLAAKTNKAYSSL